MANVNFVNVYVNTEGILKANKKNQLQEDVINDGRDEISDFVWLEYEGADDEEVSNFHEVEYNRTNNLIFAVEAEDIVIWRAIPIKSIKTKEISRTDGIDIPLNQLVSYQLDDKRFGVIADAIMLGDVFNTETTPESRQGQPNTMIDNVVYQGVSSDSGNGQTAAGFVNRAEPGDEQGYNIGVEVIDLLDRGGESTTIIAEVDPLLKGKKR